MATTSKTKKILTIDDEQAIVDLIVDILEANNYSAISATKWTEAVDALNHENPDLILLDLKMPTIHGTSMLDFIVREGFDVPVIVVSGFVTDQVAQELRNQGVKGIVRKPFKARILLDEIEKNLKQNGSATTLSQDSGAFLYNSPATPDTQSNASIDSLYGTSKEESKPNPNPTTPPANDILQALKRNAAKSDSPKEPTSSSAPNELLEALKKQADKSKQTTTPQLSPTPPPP
ncbi:MAG: response regulator, partial [Candidatus Latescibacterota bacterium]